MCVFKTRCCFQIIRFGTKNCVHFSSLLKNTCWYAKCTLPRQKTEGFFGGAGDALLKKNRSWPYLPWPSASGRRRGRPTSPRSAPGRTASGPTIGKLPLEILVGKLSPRSTQCTPLHCSKITFFSFFSEKSLEVCQKMAKVFLLIFINFGKI